MRVQEYHIGACIKGDLSHLVLSQHFHVTVNLNPSFIRLISMQVSLLLFSILFSRI